MKFRNPETGEVFSGSILRRYNPFCHATICSKCPLQGPVTNCTDTSDCSIWVVEHPHEAARLMGFEVVEDEQFREVTKMMKEANMDKPLKDWTLEECQKECENAGECCKCRLHSSSELSSCKIRIALYRKPDPAHWKLIDEPRWTQQDKKDARIIIRVFNGYQIGVRRDDIDQIVTIAKEGYPATVVNGAMFPSLRIGQSVTLDEIIGSIHDGEGGQHEEG